MQRISVRQNGNGHSISQSSIQDYYGKVLQRSEDLQTNACCPIGSPPPHIASILEQIAPEVVEKFYGCGSPIPPAIEGRIVLDLGCGTGRDTFACSSLAGERGRAVGLDMTREQLDVAKRHEEEQARTFGFSRPNTTFLHGFMEDLAAAGIEDESVDVVISNCVINLSPHKERVFREILRVLKPGGELLFSDVFADRRLDPALQDAPVLVGECLAGAMYWEDFRRLMHRMGIADVRTVSRGEISVRNAEVSRRLGAARFSSITVRAFKLAALEDRCEDYGQMATYLGTIKGHPHTFRLDDHHEFEEGRPMLVCGNTAAMLTDSRLGGHFEVLGNRSRHFGLFPCDGTAANEEKAGGGTCC